MALIADLAHAAGGTCEVVLAVAWDDPAEGPTLSERVVLAVRALPLGADRLCLGDTVGTVTPVRLTWLVHTVRQATAPVEVAVHLHGRRRDQTIDVQASLHARIATQIVAERLIGRSLKSEVLRAGNRS